MKKKTIVILLVIMILTMTVTSYGATFYNVVTSGIKIVLDGKRINPKDANGNPVEPFIYNGTTYLPVRAIADALGKEVYWDGPNYTVYLGNIDGKLEYPSAYLTENNIGKKFTVASKGDLTDNYGNTYNEGLYFHKEGKAEYLTNMQYSRLKGTLYIRKGEVSICHSSMKVIADGKVIYTSPQLSKTSKPIDFDINIRGYNHIQLQIEHEYEVGWNEILNAYLGDVGFYQ